MSEQMLARGIEKYRVGASDGIDGDDPAAFVDGQLEGQGRFFLAKQL
ncbi:MAG: hypothetical protein ABIR63_02255 [Sphingomicrobium sp.]